MACWIKEFMLSLVSWAGGVVFFRFCMACLQHFRYLVVSLCNSTVGLWVCSALGGRPARVCSASSSWKWSLPGTMSVWGGGA